MDHRNIATDKYQSFINSNKWHRNASDTNDDPNDDNYETDYNVNVAPMESVVQTRSRGGKNNVGFLNFALLTAEPMNVNEIESRSDKGMGAVHTTQESKNSKVQVGIQGQKRMKRNMWSAIRQDWLPWGSLNDLALTTMTRFSLLYATHLYKVHILHLC